MAKKEARGRAQAALLNRALAARDQGNLLQAELLFTQLLEESPQHATAHNHLGVLKFRRGELDEALAHFDSALRAEPGYADAHSSRAHALLELGRIEEALQSCQGALAADPGNPDLLYNRGVVLAQLGRHAEAAADLRKALAALPRDADVLCDLAVSLRALGDEAQALEVLNRALRENPDHARSLSNRGNALLALGRLPAAIESQRGALALEPDNGDIRLNLAIALLTAGDWTGAWPHYAWRHKAKQFAGRTRTFAQPLWSGDFDLKGRTVLLHAEQGFGDTIMFARYVPKVAALGAKVILDVQPRLKRLLERMPGAAQVLATGEELPFFDAHCPLPGLPLAFGTTPQTVPAETPYLSVDDEDRRKWRQKLGPGAKPRVGIVWSGSREYGKDRSRSLVLQDLVPVLSLPGIRFFSLQKEVGAEDAALLASLGVEQTGAEQEDFRDAAALVAEMDLVISVDTAVSHLAGALGKPAWLMLAFSPDWRWMREREDSPWYPATRLFRQQAPGEGWASTLERMTEALQRRLSSRDAAAPAR